MPVVTFTAGQVLTAAQMNQIGQDSGWLAVSASQNSWTGTCYYRKVGTLVTLLGSVSGGSANAVGLTLPSGYRPSGGSAGGTYYYAGVTSGNVLASFSIAPSGDINLRSSNATQFAGTQFYTD